MILANSQLPGSGDIEDELRVGTACLRVDSQLPVLIRAPAFYRPITKKGTHMSQAAIHILGLADAADRLGLARLENDRGTVAVQGDHNGTETIHGDIESGFRR